MGSFDSIIESATSRVYNKFGLSATYIKTNLTEIECTVIIEEDLQRYGNITQINANSFIISFMKSEVFDAPRRGEKVELSDGTVYVLEALQSTNKLEHKISASCQIYSTT